MAKKPKTIYYCSNCGVDSPKWVGRCPSCNEWNTFVEEKVLGTEKKVADVNFFKESKPVQIDNVIDEKSERLKTSINEFNRVMGGGIIPGSLTLIGGEPGIGKSTIAMQIALGVTQKVLYISGEESISQISIRAKRLSMQNPNCLLYSQVCLEDILHTIDDIKPQLVVVDSIQTMYSNILEAGAGSVSQIRECTSQILKKAKTSNIPVILIGHVTKDGVIAGPKVMEHIVDTVLQFEGDKQNIYRVLRATKNRFGSTSEIGIFKMESKGLQPINNPSEIFISQNNERLSGVTIASVIDGVRPFLIEVQALVSTAAYGTPQRSTTGYDTKRLNMLLAVLERKAGFKLAAKDVFLNIAGGLRVNDTATDLAVASAILSSNFDKHITPTTCMAAEISLTGELKPVARIEQRIKEAEKFGFTKIITSDLPNELDAYSINATVYKCNKLEEAMKIIFQPHQD